MSGTQVVAKAQPTKAEFEQWMKAAHGREALEYQASLVVAMALAGWSLYDRVRGEAGPVLGWARDVVMVAMFAGWLWLSVRTRGQTAARLAAEEPGETTFRFSVEGVVSVDPQAGANCKWTRFTRVLETADLYVLQMRGGTATLVPKRGFASPGDEAAFRRLADLAGLTPVKAWPGGLRRRSRRGSTRRGP